MNLKKLLMIICIFITALLSFNYICYFILLINGSTIYYDGDSVVDSFLKIPLYMMGYGESPNIISTYFQLVLCILGIIMINFLNAYLTVAVFRFKKVKIDDKVDISCGIADDFTAFVKIINRGRQIYKVQLTIQVYKENSNGTVEEIGNCEFTKPVINARGNWLVPLEIEIGDFMFEFFRNQYKGDKSLKLQAVFEYLDNETGNQIVIAQELNEFYQSNEKRSIYMNSEFIKFISNEVKQIDLSRTRKIIQNGDDNAMKISYNKTDNKQMIDVNLDFTKKGSLAPPTFIMALIEYGVSEDWSNFYSKGYSLEFDICSSASIKAIQLEIKGNPEGVLTKVVDIKIDTTNEYTRHSIKLSKFSENPLLWSMIKEICFTSLLSYSNGAAGSFKVKDLKLIPR